MLPNSLSNASVCTGTPFAGYQSLLPCFIVPMTRSARKDAQILHCLSSEG